MRESYTLYGDALSSPATNLDAKQGGQVCNFATIAL